MTKEAMLVNDGNHMSRITDTVGDFAFPPCSLTHSALSSAQPLFPGESEYNQFYRIVTSRGLPNDEMIAEAPLGSRFFTPVEGGGPPSQGQASSNASGAAGANAASASGKLIRVLISLLRLFGSGRVCRVPVQHGWCHDW